MDIRFFRPSQGYGFLSNYYESPFALDGREWPSVEHYFQAQKLAARPETEEIRRAPSPNGAKSFAHSRRDQWRPDWEAVRCDVMRKAVLAKFQASDSLRQALLDTGDARLVEDSPRDTFWGCGQDGSGKNMLGLILMEVREALHGQRDAVG